MSEGPNPSISIIIPMYNVEGYVLECMESIERQTYSDYEVILVDDGSTDATAQIASAYAASKDFCTYVYKENGGSGSARNLGVDLSRGTYISFVDPDDLLEEHMYERMVAALERHQADMAICHARRFNSSGYGESLLHKNTFNNTPDCTNVFESPQLIYDTAVWNKLVRKDFYLKAGVRFPEQIRYQDIPVSLPLHFHAKKVAVVHEYCYYWRVRDRVSKSVTQKTNTLRNLKNRIQAMNMLEDILATIPDNSVIKEAWRTRSLEQDLNIFVNEIPNKQDVAERDLFADLIIGYVNDRHLQDYLDKTSIICHEKYLALLERDFDRLSMLRAFQLKDYYNVPVRYEGGRVLARLPKEANHSLRNDITDELNRGSYREYIDAMKVSPQRIDVYAHVYARRQELPEGSQIVRAKLYDETTGQSIGLDVEPWVCNKLTKSQGVVHSDYYNEDAHYNYDGAGFHITMDLSAPTFAGARSGSYILMAEYRNTYNCGRVPLLFASKRTHSGVDGMSALYDDRMMTVTSTEHGTTHFSFESGLSLLESRSLEGDDFICGLSAPVAKLYADAGDTERRYEFEKVDDRHYRLDTRAIPFDATLRLTCVDSAGRAYALPMAERVMAIVENEDCSLELLSLRNYRVRIKKRPLLACVEHVNDSGNVLSLEVSLSASATNGTPLASCALMAEDRAHNSWTRLADGQLRDGDGSRVLFTLDFDQPSLYENLYSCYRKLRVSFLNAQGFEGICPLVSKPYYSHVFDNCCVRVKVFRDAEGLLALNTERSWSEELNAYAKRTALRDEVYPAYRKKPVKRNLVLFESNAGRAYAASPRALYEYLDAHHPKHTCVWALYDERSPIAGGGRRVRKGTPEYYQLLATAKYLVINEPLEDCFQKRPDQVVIQTDLDAYEWQDANGGGQDLSDEAEASLLRVPDDWDYALVRGDQPSHSVLEGPDRKVQLLGVGYPRTDVLLSCTEEKAYKIREAIGLPLDKKLVLYAPSTKSLRNYKLEHDLARLRERLAGDYAILLYLQEDQRSSQGFLADNDFVYNLSFYDSVQDLMMASHMLASDDRPMILDYLLLGKPLFIFNYDFEDMSDDAGGSEVMASAFAQLECHGNGDLIEAILQSDSRVERTAPAVAALKEAYLSYESAASSEAVAKAVFESGGLLKAVASVGRRLLRR